MLLEDFLPTNILETMFNLVLSDVQVYRFPKPAAPRRMNLKHITGQHVSLADVAQAFDTAAFAHDYVLPDLSRLAARHAKGAMFAAVGQNSGCHCFQKAHSPDATIAALILAGTA